MTFSFKVPPAVAPAWDAVVLRNGEVIHASRGGEPSAATGAAGPAAGPPAGPPLLFGQKGAVGGAASMGGACQAFHLVRK